MNNTKLGRLTVIASCFLAFGTGCKTASKESSTVKEVVATAAIDGSTGIPAWNARLEEHAARAGIDVENEGYSECASVNEIRGAYLCASVYVRHTNEALTRASIFVEGMFGSPKGTVVGLSSGPYNKGLRNIGGHDLTSEDLSKFWTALKQACGNGQNSDFCPNAREKEFFQGFILPKLQNNEKFVIISYALHGIMGWEEVVTHEMMHAQYFLEPKFRATADSFWKEKVSEQDKRDVLNALAPYYNKNDELLMKNEFQAYILMANASGSVLSQFVQKYRAPLMSAMQLAGVKPLQVQSTPIVQPDNSGNGSVVAPASLTVICVDRAASGVAMEFDATKKSGPMKFYAGQWKSAQNQFIAVYEFAESKYTLETQGGGKIKVDAVSAAGDKNSMSFDLNTMKGNAKLTFSTSSIANDVDCFRDPS